MGQDKDHDFLTELMNWCNQLSTTGHESFIITTNLQHRKMYLSGSRIGKMFLSREREICNRFFKFCQDIHSSESAITLPKEVTSSLESSNEDVNKNNNRTTRSKGRKLQTSSKTNELSTIDTLAAHLKKNQDKSSENFTVLHSTDKTDSSVNLSYGDDSRVFETNLYDPNIAKNIKQETDDLTEYLGARTISETEFLGLQVHTNVNMNDDPKESPYGNKRSVMDIVSSHGTESNSENVESSNENWTVTESADSSQEVTSDSSSSIFGKGKRKTYVPQRRAVAFQPEHADKATEKINPAAVDEQIKQLLRIKIKKEPFEKFKDNEGRSLRSSDSHVPKIIHKGSRKMYQCKVCDLKLCSMSSFKRHYLLHDKRGKKEVCPTCGKRFLRKEDVKKHQQAVHLTRTKEFKCPLCESLLKTYNSLKTHVRKIHNEDVYNFRNPVGQKPDLADDDKYCTFCFRTFRTRTGLANHLAVHYSSSVQTKYICEKCGRVIGSRRRFIRHKYTHAAEKSHYCEVCKKAFATFESKHSHRLVFHSPYSIRALNLAKSFKDENGKLACEICGGIFRSPSTLRKHLCSHDRSTEERRRKNQVVEGKTPSSTKSNNLEVKLEINDVKEEPRSRPSTPEIAQSKSTVILSERDLNNSNKWIEKPEKCKPYACEICNETFSSMNIYRNHIASHHTSKRTYPCELCGKVFFRSLALTRHKLAHNKEGKFPCDICGHKSNTRENLVRHAKVHWLIKPHRCEICGKGFTESKNLKIHTISHTKEKPFNCEICKKSFRTGKQYRDHLRVHTGERPFKCKICYKGFRAIDVLRNHLKVHSEVKPYMCHQCGKIFRQRSSLITHRKSHLPEPSHKCQICGKGCRSSGSLKSHYVSYHLDHNDLDSYGLKVYKCHICSKLFGEKQDCDRHLRIHTGEKPFVCDVCGKAFSDKSNMRSHKKIHDNDRPYVCDLCGKGFIFNRDLKKHKISHEKDTIKEIKNTKQSKKDTRRGKAEKKILPQPAVPQIAACNMITAIPQEATNFVTPKTERVDSMESTFAHPNTMESTSTYSAAHPNLVAAISGTPPNQAEAPPTPVQLFLSPTIRPLPAVAPTPAYTVATNRVCPTNQNIGTENVLAPVKLVPQPGTDNSTRTFFAIVNNADSPQFTLFTADNLTQV